MDERTPKPRPTLERSNGRSSLGSPSPTFVSTSRSSLASELSDDVAAWEPFHSSESKDDGVATTASLHSDDDFEADQWVEDNVVGSGTDDLDGSLQLQDELLNTSFRGPCHVSTDGEDTGSKPDDDSFVSRDSISTRGFSWEKARLVTMLSTRSLLSETIDEQTTSSANSNTATRSCPEIKVPDPKEVARLQKKSPEELAIMFIQMQQRSARLKQQQALGSSTGDLGLEEGGGRRRPRRSKSDRHGSRRRGEGRRKSRRPSLNAVEVERPDEPLSSWASSSSHF